MGQIISQLMDLLMDQGRDTPTVNEVATIDCNGSISCSFFRSPLSSDARTDLISRFSRTFSLETNAITKNIDSEQGSRRRLQGKCEFYDFDFILNIAIVYDNTFCKDHGGKDSSEAIIREVLRQASEVYENTVCIKFAIEDKNIMGFCDDGDDNDDKILPTFYENALKTADGDQRLIEFREAFQASYPTIISDSSIVAGHEGIKLLFTGSGSTDFIDNAVKGVAWPRGLCRRGPSGIAYGAIQFSGKTAIKCKNALTIVLHEIGHIVGGFNDHVGGDKIMNDPFCDGCKKFSTGETTILERGLYRLDDTDTIEGIDRNSRCITDTIGETTEDPSKTTEIPSTSPPSNIAPPVLSPVDRMPSSSPFPALRPTSRPTSVLEFDTLPPISSPDPIIDSASGRQVPIALPSTLGGIVATAAGWYAKRRLARPRKLP